MKKIFILFLCIIVSSAYVIANEINLDEIDPGFNRIVNINNPANEKAFSKLKLKLKNCGFFLQNSISPVEGVEYNSGKFIEPTQYKKHK